MKRHSFFLLSVILFAAPPSRAAELVHVFQQTVAGTSTNQLSDTVLKTGASYVTQDAPAIDG